MASIACADQKVKTVNKEIVYVDGYMDEAYSSSGKITVDQIINQNGTSDTTADIYLLYDNSFVYIFGSVNDKTRVSTPPEHDWITDSVEIQLDLDCYENGQPVSSGYTGMFRIIRYSGKMTVVSSSSSPFFTAVQQYTQCRVVDRNEGGYDFEIAIPHSNNFRGAKLGLSCVINDASDSVKNLTAMIFMNSNHVGGYNNTKEFYTFDLSHFSNARQENPDSAVSNNSADGQASDGENEQNGNENQPSKIPERRGTGGIDPILLYGLIAASACILIVLLIILATKKKQEKE